jgi:hypothetical protein
VALPWVRVVADRETTLDPLAQRPNHCCVFLWLGRSCISSSGACCAMEMPSPSQVLLLCLMISSLGAMLWFLL